MKIIMRGASSLRLAELHRPGFDLAGGPAAETFGPVSLLVCAYGWCTFSVLASYGVRIDTPAWPIVIDADWQLGERPHRIARIELAIYWPKLPDSRVDAAMRAATTCTVHQTLKEGVALETSVHAFAAPE